MLLKTSLKYGLILGMFVVIATQILTWVGLGLTNWFVLCTFLGVILFSFFGARELKHKSGNQISFRNAALSVIIIILLSRVIFQIYMFVYTQYIDPDWVNTVVESWTETLQAANTPDDKIEKQMTAFRKSYEPLSMFTVQLINYGLPQVVIGIIASLPLVLKRKK